MKAVSAYLRGTGWPFSLAITALFAFGVGLRFFRLGWWWGSGWDEGAYLMVGRLIDEGYTPYSEIYLPQLPLFLHNLALAFHVFGHSVFVGRALAVAYSALALLATAFVAGRLGGRLAALAALLILAVNRVHLGYSRAVYLEGPAIALGMLALAVLLAAPRSRLALSLAGLLWAGGVFMKPFVLGLGLTLVLHVMLERRHEPQRLRRLLGDALALIAGVLVLVAVFLLTTDLPAFYHQFFGVNARLVPGNPWTSLMKHLAPLGRDEGLLALAGFALLGCARAGPSVTPLALGVLALLALILQVPPIRHHMVVVLPPLAALAGVGVEAFRERAAFLRPSRWTLRRTTAASLGAIAVAAYLQNVPQIFRMDRKVFSPDPAACSVAMTRIVRALVPRDTFVLSDRPMIAYRAGTLIPPGAAMAGGFDLMAGGVTTSTLKQAAEKYHVGVVVASGRFRSLKDWMPWVEDRFRSVDSCREVDGDLIEVFESLVNPRHAPVPPAESSASAGGSRP